MTPSTTSKWSSVHRLWRFNRTRWGSCSSRRVKTLLWIQFPYAQESKITRRRTFGQTNRIKELNSSRASSKRTRYLKYCTWAKLSSMSMVRILWLRKPTWHHRKQLSTRKIKNGLGISWCDERSTSRWCLPTVWIIGARKCPTQRSALPTTSRTSFWARTSRPWSRFAPYRNMRQSSSRKCSLMTLELTTSRRRVRARLVTIWSQGIWWLILLETSSTLMWRPSAPSKGRITATRFSLRGTTVLMSSRFACPRVYFQKSWEVSMLAEYYALTMAAFSFAGASSCSSTKIRASW